MTAATALALYPSWAVAMVVGLTALRLGRGTGRGLVAVCFTLALWVTALILFQLDDTARLAERVLPLGMLIGAALIHAGADLVAPQRRWPVAAAYLYALVVAAIGAVAPSLYYAPGLTAPGPLTWPLAAISAFGTIGTAGWLARAARGVTGRQRRRLIALSAGCVLGSLGGGVAVLGQVTGHVELALTAPALAATVLLAGYAVLDAQVGASRRLVTQGLTYALLTATLSAFGLVLFFRLLPSLTPHGTRSVVWLVVVMFFAALPLDAVRVLVVEAAGRRLFGRPIGVRDLADEIGRTEARAEHAERLAAIGTMASAVAHEIRNPLGIIAAQAKLLERRGADPEQVAALREQVERAKRFLDDLLRYSKPRPLDIAVVGVAGALGQAVASLRAAATTPLPTIELDLDGAGALEVEADAAAFHDVHLALVHNAVAAVHGRDGGRVRIGAARRGDAVEVTIEDDGPGVAPEIEDRLFQPFVSGRGRDSAHPGTGLGLAICAGWMERHGGALHHQRPAEGGARFVVRWPTRHASHG